MDLVGYLFGSVPEEERVTIEAELLRRPELRQELEELRRQWVLPLSTDDDIDPPLGLAERTVAALSDPVLSTTRRVDAPSSSSLRVVDVAVAAGILLVASFLVLPAIASIRGDQGRVQCANNLRQVGVSLASYQAIEQVLPSPAPQEPLNHAGVFALLLQARDLLPEAQILICPTADSAVVYVPRLTDYLAQPTGSLVQTLQKRDMAGSYGYSLGHREGTRYRGLAESSGFEPLVSDRPPREENDEAPGHSPNHGDWGQNVLFADGHVAWLGEAKIGNDELFRSDHDRIEAGVNSEDHCIGVSEAEALPDE